MGCTAVKAVQSISKVYDCEVECAAMAKKGMTGKISFEVKLMIFKLTTHYNVK